VPFAFHRGGLHGPYRACDRRQCNSVLQAIFVRAVANQRENVHPATGNRQTRDIADYQDRAFPFRTRPLLAARALRLLALSVW
jgi:hypothetical protein